MKINEIENRIDRAVNFALQSGYQIIQYHWGVYNYAANSSQENNWESKRKVCCPLGAVVLFSKLKVVDPVLKYNAFYYVMKEFNVDRDWINSFNHGFDNLKIRYCGNQEARSLGVKMRYRYVGQSITFNV